MREFQLTNAEELGGRIQRMRSLSGCFSLDEQESAVHYAQRGLATAEAADLPQMEAHGPALIAERHSRRKRGIAGGTAPAEPPPH